MTYYQDDLYLPSGTGQLINNWVDPVYKFDSSSFYNWEQDNLPIYDLEDRDDFLHEMAGYPASATAPTIMLTVSSCGVDNKKVFASLSGAVEALPNTIRQPVIIEVCVSGELGALELANKEIVASGAGLEIINRGFGRVLCGSGAGVATSATMTNATASAVTTFTSVDTSNTLSHAFCVGSQSRVGANEANPWTFFSQYNRTFVLPPEWSKAAAQSTKTVAISTGFHDFGSNNALLSTTANVFNVGYYYDNSVDTDIIVKNYNAADAGVLNNRPNVEFESGKSRVTGYIYANALTNVSIKNCSGKIYVRGFCVDGATQASIRANGSQRTDVGFDIDGSEVVIENCTATRCKKAGLQAVNSDVTLNRGFVAALNYELENSGGGVFLGQKKTSVPTAGMRAINSNVTLSSAIFAKYGCPVDSPYVFTRNMIGVELENSTLTTPLGYRYGLTVEGNSLTEVYGSETLMLQTFLNINEGIKAKNSLIDWSGRLASFQNRVGMDLDGATCQVQEATIDHNQEAGILATGSIFNYNKNAQAITRSGPFNPLTNFQNNGQHVVMKGSQFIPTSVSGMDTIYERLIFSGNHQIINTSGAKTVLPAVDISKGSYMNAVCPLSIGLVSETDSTSAKYAHPVKGSEYSVTEESSLDLNGTGRFATYAIGPVDSGKQQQVAGLYAGKNSSIHIAGPTSIVQFGVDALAEDGSTIKIAPQSVGGVVDASGWSLYNTDNHTKVQLHSTRASLVANQNSNLIMENLGDYHAHWAGKYITANDFPTGDVAQADFGDRYYASGYFSQGSLQFYANPFTPYANSVGQLNLESQAAYPTAAAGMGRDATTYITLPVDDIGTDGNEVSSLSYGGFCVRAIGGSTVKARNVLFPAGWTNPSGPYYDASTAGNCDLLRIWNIADSSKLHASYLSVGNSTAHGGAIGHPQDLSTIYYGPSAVWVSSFGDAGTGLSGAPSSTADTSGLSVLDTFGSGVQTGGDLGFYGKTYPENIGPFRIYVGIDPKANFLGYPIADNMTYMPPVPKTNPYISMGYTFPDRATLLTGPPKQLYAQGYATSGDVSAINTQGPNYYNPSAMYPDLGGSGYIATLPLDQQVENVVSSFFYTKDMIPTDTAANIWLDESAMNTFANAKNGTLGTSDRKKIFSYYKAITDSTGEGFFDATQGHGIGSVNLFDLDRYL